MDRDLYDKYGEYNIDGYYISDHDKWSKYAEQPNLYKRKKFFAWCWLIIPVCGIVGMSLTFDEMGLSIF